MSASLVRESWPWSPHDTVELPDGRPIGEVPSSDLTTALVESGVPGASHEWGRLANIDAYLAHLKKLKEAGGRDAVARWISEGRRRVIPQALAFRETKDGLVVVGGWPSRALIETANLTDPPPHMAVDGQVVTIGVVNGFASYRRRKDVTGGWLCSIGEHEYVPLESSAA
jgi:hypothetical protein